MTATADLPGFYRGAINLWVEDPLVRDYLREAWAGDPAVVFYVGGGREGVLAIVKEAEEAGLRNVFAYVDRDLYETNRPDWTDPNKTSRRFVASVHEIENFLLDEEALAGCRLNTGNRTCDEIRDRLQQRAAELDWWMACRRVIVEIREGFWKGFPAHPNPSQVNSQSTAEQYLRSSPWLDTLPQRTAGLRPADVSDRLAAEYRVTRQQIADGSWKTQFSGRELFRSIRGWVYTVQQSASSPSVLDADLANSVGRWQADNQRVPQELADLLAAMKVRAIRP